MKKHCTTLAAALATSFIAFAAVPLEWKTTPRNPAPAAFDRHHGETLDLRCRFEGFGELPFADAADVRLWYQTNGMGAAWWSLPATVSSNVLAATFPPQADPGADRLALFFGAPSNAYASAVLRLRSSPGFTPNVLPPPDTESFEETDPVFAAWLADGYAIRHPSVEWLDIYGSETPGDGVIMPGRPWHRDSWRWYKDYLRITRTFYQGTTLLSNDTRTVSLPDYPEGDDAFALASQVASQVSAVSNDVCNIVTNEVVAGCTKWTVLRNGSIVNVGQPTFNTSVEAWEVVVIPSDTIFEEYALGNQDAMSLSWSALTEDGFDAPFANYTATRSYFYRNALGLAHLDDLPPLTNELPAMAAAAVYDVHDLRWDEDEQILYWCKFVGGHDLCIAVTNINLTHPTNAVLLKKWRETNR